MGYVTLRVLCYNWFISGSVGIYKCVAFIYIHSTHTSVSSPSKLCQMLKTAQIGTHVFLQKFRCLRFLKIVSAQPYVPSAVSVEQPSVEQC